MLALGFLILVAALFVIGTAAGLTWYFASPRQSRPRIIKVAAIPFGCTSGPLVGVVAWALLAPVFQKNDLSLYQEIFGSGTTVAEQSMLFDDFGQGKSREIYMRINPDGAEREYLLNLPGIRSSEAALPQFESRGEQHGFTWWITSDPNHPRYCPSARLLEADGFRGWKELRIAECIDPVSDVPTSMNRGEIYVIAWHRE